MVTGRKEDVARAKREILSAAEHFSQIRASRKSSLGALLGAPPGPPASVPGHVTIQVRVPYRVVGLVVGPKGATIKRIQHQTHTYIVTPSRDKEPVFEVTGLPESVEAARREIEAHIALRTGTGTTLDDSELLSVLCRGGLGSILGCLDPPGSNGSNGSSGAFSSSGSCSSSSSSSGAPGLNDLVAIWGAGMERDEGLGESPSFESQTASASSIWSFQASRYPRGHPRRRQRARRRPRTRCWAVDGGNAWCAATRRSPPPSSPADTITSAWTAATGSARVPTRAAPCAPGPSYRRSASSLKHRDRSRRDTSPLLPQAPNCVAPATWYSGSIRILTIDRS